MKLKALIKNLDLSVKGSKEIEITGVCSDSRVVAPGNLFIAKKGCSYDGTQFIHQAVAAGAVAILTDIYDPFLEQTQVISPKVSDIESKLVARYFANPSQDLFVVGVTGTKGKTTTSYLVKHLLDGLKKTAGLISTVETVIGANRFPSTLTTHDIISNQRWLKEMVKKECKAAVMEVSSHGLAQGRVEEIDFDVGIFTNLSPDHLDYHLTFENYAKEKEKLIAKSKYVILNADSYWGQFEGFSFGIEKGNLRPENLKMNASGTEFDIEGCHFKIPLIGRFNVYNALAAISVGLHLGEPLSKIRDVLAEFKGVPGRLERYGNVFVDFAHSGVALENVLQTLKEIVEGRLIVVFGSGGERDPLRRETMGKAADKWADLSIVTSDNPRGEDPNEIIRQIVAHFKKKPLVEADRKNAIHLALDLAEEKDFVLIAGRGHEQYQLIGGQKVPFEDMAVVKERLKNQMSSAMVNPL